MKYPLDLIGLYLKHLLVGMTPTWREVYITDIHTQKGILITVSLAIWLISGLNVLENFWRKKWSGTVWYCAAIGFPCLLQMAGTVEVRFLIPAYVMVYYYVFVEIDYSALWAEIRSRALSILVTMMVIFVMWTSIIGTVLALNTEKTFLIHDYSVVQEAE